ncbi:MAG: hypothetical protein AB2693_31225, partial [Candidatus Thiodiazotropha sp.]
MPLESSLSDVFQTFSAQHISLPRCSLLLVSLPLVNLSIYLLILQHPLTGIMCRAMMRFWGLDSV